MSTDDCYYGSMQVHGEDTTIFAFNAWSTNSVDEMGFGNNQGTEDTDHPDWTYAYVVFEAKRSLTHITKKLIKILALRTRTHARTQL